MPSSEIGSANSAPILSPAVHLTTALARSRPGKHQPDPRADLEPASAVGHEAALGDVEHLRLDAARAELAHLRVELDRKRAQAPAVALWSSAMRALIVTKLISIGAATPAGAAKDKPIRPSLTHRTCAETMPRSRSCSGSRSPMLGTCGKITIAPDEETLTSRTTCLRPRNSSTAVLETAAWRALAALVDRCAARCAESSRHRERSWTPLFMPSHLEPRRP